MDEPALVATIAADPRPARALRDHIAQHAAAGRDADAVRLFESLFYRLPPFADDVLPALAAACYRRLGLPDPAFLLDGLAAQLQPPRAAAGISADAARILAAPDPDTLLLGALEGLARAENWIGSAQVFESVWPHARPIGGYWIYHRMSAVYQALGRHDAAALMAALAVQIEPDAREAHEPCDRLFRRFRATGRLRDAAELALRRHARCPGHPLMTESELADLLQRAGPLAAPPGDPPRVRVIVPAETRAPRRWRVYGGGLPAALAEMQAPMQRPAVTVTELRDAEVLIADNDVAVFGADGTLQTGLSVGRLPALLGRRLQAMQAAGRAVATREIGTAVLNIDSFPAPNLCHFLFDYASRLLLYRRAGIDLAAATVIGPVQSTEYQRATAGRIGLGAWHATDAPARLRVRRLYVSSNCRHLCHSAHWGAAWALDGLRALFDVTPRVRSRRLLISRADSPYRRLANEAEIMAVLASYGFEIVVPGQLTFADQTATFRDATHVVGPHGAGFGNILFCAPGTHVLELFHPHYATWSYAMPADGLGLDYAPLLGRDGASDAAEFNDPAWPLPHRTAHSDRDIRADPAEIRRWLRDTGAD